LDEAKSKAEQQLKENNDMWSKKLIECKKQVLFIIGSGIQVIFYVIYYIIQKNQRGISSVNSKKLITMIVG